MGKDTTITRDKLGEGCWAAPCGGVQCAEFNPRGCCPACHGDGRIPDRSGGGHHGVCPVCKGSGNAPVQTTLSPCNEQAAS